MGTVRLNADIDEKMAMELFHTLVDEKLDIFGLASPTDCNLSFRETRRHKRKPG